MKNNRRDFIKLAVPAIAGMTSVIAGITPTFGAPAPVFPDLIRDQNHERQQKFNMSGYAAPKLETVRIGFIGLGNRGPAAVVRMSKIGGVEIKALCDLRSEKANAAKKRIEGSGQNPAIYSGNKEEWKKSM